MPLLQVRDLPDHLYRKLSQEAEKEHRSLSQQAIAVLARGLSTHANPRERRKAALELAATVDRRRTRNLPDPVRLIREDRER